MRKLTLNNAWKYCLQMWKWIAEQVRKGTNKSACSLKAQWAKEHGHKNLRNDCFFCEYDEQKNFYSGCSKCPGKLVNKKLGDYWCEPKIGIDWEYNPIEFYQKLLLLNKKRLQKAKGKK